MAKPTDKFTWATDANFSSGPDTGNATKANPPGYPAVTQGSVPGLGVIAAFYNKCLNVLGDWMTWLDAGSSAGAGDAHIVETDANGDTQVRGVWNTREADPEATRVTIDTADVEIRAAAAPNQGRRFLIDSSGLDGTHILTINVDPAALPEDFEEIELIFNNPHATNHVDIYSEGGTGNPILATTANTAQTIKCLFDASIGSNGEWIITGVIPHV